MIDILVGTPPATAASKTFFDAATVSAFAAAFAALAAAAVGAIQLYVGRKQAAAALLSAQAATTNAQAAVKTAESAGRRRIAEFRQEWIDKVIDTLSEYLAAVIMERDDGGPQWGLDQERIVALRTKLEILLNPEEQNTKDLLSASGLLQEWDSPDGPLSVAERREQAPAIIAIARQLLKAEWVRIKTELQ